MPSKEAGHNYYSGDKDPKQYDILIQKWREYDWILPKDTNLTDLYIPSELHPYLECNPPEKWVTFVETLDIPTKRYLNKILKLALKYDLNTAGDLHDLDADSHLHIRGFSPQLIRVYHALSAQEE